MSVQAEEIVAGRELPAIHELADELFASFPRRDQRRKGELYLRGLLQAQGRKTIRNIAAQVDGEAVEQSLHHFISSSTWDWVPVRKALARHLERASSPHAWVMQPMCIPKSGEQSVGVHQVQVPELGQAFHGQRAFGVWHVSQDLSVPVNWRLHLPESWLRDRTRRRQADIPVDVRQQTGDECAAATALETMAGWRMPSRPVVLNTHIDRITDTVDQFTRQGVPVIARVGGTARLTVRDPGVPVLVGKTYGAQQILVATKGMRRRVEWSDPAGPAAAYRVSWVVAVQVKPSDRLPGIRPFTSGKRDGGLTLLGEWEDPQCPPVGLWVTNMESLPVGALLRITKFAGQVEHALAETGEDVGLKDFDGRSFHGWHRHISLASAAHAVAARAGVSNLPNDCKASWT